MAVSEGAAYACERFAQLVVFIADDLAKLSDDQILNVRDVGVSTLAAIRKALGTRSESGFRQPPASACSSDSGLPNGRPHDSISSLGLSRRAYHALKRAGVHTIGQLRALSSTELLAIRSIGVATAAEIRRKLGDHLSPAPLPYDEGAYDTEIRFAPLAPNLVNDEAPLAVLDLERRYAGILGRRIGVAIVGELARYTRQELLAIRWVGTNMVTAVERALAAWEQMPSVEKQRRVLLQTATPSASTADSGTSRAVQATEPLPDTLGALVSQWLQGLPARDRDIVCARLGVGCAIETLQRTSPSVQS
jgi:hypothetical protein